MDAHLLALGDELRRVVLRHHRLQGLVDDGRQHALVEVRAQVAVNLWQRGAGTVAGLYNMHLSEIEIYVPVRYGQTPSRSFSFLSFGAGARDAHIPP